MHDDRAFQPWLGQIAKRVCWQLKKREALLPLLQLSMLEKEGKEIQNDEPPVDTQLPAREMKELFHQAVRKLPSLYQMSIGCVILKICRGRLWRKGCAFHRLP